MLNRVYKRFQMNDEEIDDDETQPPNDNDFD